MIFEELWAVFTNSQSYSQLQGTVIWVANAGLRTEPAPLSAPRYAVIFGEKTIF